MSALPAWFLPLVAVTIGILMALFGYVLKLASDISEIKGQRAITCAEHGAKLACLPEMKRQLDRLVYRQELADSHAADGLHSPDHHERDELVANLVAGKLDEEGLKRAVDLLRKARSLERSADKRFYATTLLARAETELKMLRRD